MTRRQVAVTGLGALTALGGSVESFWAGLLAGRSAIAPVSLFDPGRYGEATAAEIRSLPKDPCGEIKDRAHLLALAAASEALGGRGDFGGPRAGVVVGTTLGGNRTFTAWLEGSRAPLAESTMEAAAQLIAARRRVRGVVRTVSVACASGTAAVGMGADLIRRGELDQVLAGGTDALSEFVFSGFDSLRALSPSGARPFDRRRDGLSLGEGAGFLLLEEAEEARQRGARILAFVRGYGSSADAHHMTRPSPDGAGLYRALSAAVADAGISADEIGFISSHGTGTVFNDRMEAGALRSLLGARSREVPVNGIKGAIGHTLGAAGALEAVLSVLVLSRGLIPPTAGHEEPDPQIPLFVVARSALSLPQPPSFALSTSSAFGGTNAALILERA